MYASFVAYSSYSSFQETSLETYEIIISESVT